MRKVIRSSGVRPAVIAGAGVVALAGAVLAAPPASADTEARVYHMGSGTFSYSAGDGSSDAHITMGDATTEVVIDDVVPITVGTGCVHPDASDTTRVVCAIPADTADTAASGVSIHVDLGGGNDALLLRAGSGNAVDGGPGDDEMDVNAATYTVRGDAGDDRLLGAASFMYGNDGNDHVIGGDRNEYLAGGTGHDYIEAGFGADVVFGNSGEDTIRGGRGDDEIYGGADPDLLYGNSGNDLLIGGGGHDHLSGGPDDDTLVQG
ncbi:calcium-binding protein [Streptomyces sp. 6N223]|uniref:calcium-binding protein n=1 Tax=Streptomyces sp. 6N223 TaxID=3457412 RepID=UPI003FD2A3A5